MENKELAKIYVVKLLVDIKEDYYCKHEYKKDKLLSGFILEKARLFWVANTQDNIDIKKVKVLYEYIGKVL